MLEYMNERDRRLHIRESSDWIGVRNGVGTI